jgi:hypothetical protein
MTKTEAYEIIEQMGNAVIQRGLVSGLEAAGKLKEAIDTFKPEGYRPKVQQQPQPNGRAKN